jgi:LysR family transcriptional regulator, benzoate and cis,cis-muconate-responsive activator of ben and cat genes
VNLRTLQYFVVLAEELNFSRAAQQLHVAQPALSQQIRGLEKDWAPSWWTGDDGHCG